MPAPRALSERTVRVDEPGSSDSVLEGHRTRPPTRSRPVPARLQPLTGPTPDASPQAAQPPIPSSASARQGPSVSPTCRQARGKLHVRGCARPERLHRPERRRRRATEGPPAAVGLISAGCARAGIQRRRASLLLGAPHPDPRGVTVVPASPRPGDDGVIRRGR
jgi:hypothetical protein